MAAGGGVRYAGIDNEVSKEIISIEMIKSLTRVNAGDDMATIDGAHLLMRLNTHRISPRASSIIIVRFIYVVKRRRCALEECESSPY